MHTSSRLNGVVWLLAVRGLALGLTVAAGAGTAVAQQTAPPQPQTPSQQTPATPPSVPPQPAGTGQQPPAQPQEPQDPRNQDPVAQDPQDPRAVPVQTTEVERPYQGLFGGGDRQPGSPFPPRVTLTLGGYGGYDDNAIAERVQSGADPRAQLGSSFAGGSALLAYQRRASARTSVGATLAGDYRYLTEASDLSASSYSAGAGINRAFSARTNLNLAGNVAYQPFYQFGLPAALGEPLIGAPTPSNLNLAILEQASWIYNASIGFSRRLSRVSTLDVSYTLNRQDFTGGQAVAEGEQDFSDITGHAAGFLFRRTLTRNMGLRLGYSYRYGTYPLDTTRTFGGHNLDVGVDYHRSLQFSRKTSFSFSTGTSIVRADDSRYFYRFTGFANLRHEFNRQWIFSTLYNRGMEFIASFSEPFFTDVLTTRLDGYFNRRTSMRISLGMTNGQVGLEGASRDVTLFTGDAGIQFAVTRNLAFDASYYRFYYNFDTGVLLPGQLAPRLDRNGVRAGLTLFLPVVR
jgi:hypothetical protein